MLTGRVTPPGAGPAGAVRRRPHAPGRRAPMSDADLSGSPFEMLDPRFAAVINPSAKLERLATGCRWAEGPAYFPRGPLPRLVRHPERPHAALGRDGRQRLGVPLAVRLHERPDRRPPGSPRLLRAPGPPGDPDGDRRDAHGAGRPLPGQAPQLAQRRRREVRRLDLVHRPVLRHRPRLRGRCARTASSTAATSTGSTPTRREVTRVADDFARPNGLAFSPDESKLYIADSGRTHDPDGPHHIRGLRRRTTAARCRAATSSRSASPGSSTASASTRPAGCGPRRATACSASTRTGR